MCHTVSGLAGNRCAEVPYREDGGGSVEVLLGWGGWGCLQINYFIVCDYSVWGFSATLDYPNFWYFYSLTKISLRNL